MGLVGLTVPCGTWKEIVGRRGRSEGGGICVMSSPRKAAVFQQSGQSTRPRLSAALDGLSRDIVGLCGCISHEPGVCSCRQEQPDSLLHRDVREIHERRRTQFIVVCPFSSWVSQCAQGLRLSLFLGSDNTLSLALCTVRYSNYQ